MFIYTLAYITLKSKKVLKKNKTEKKSCLLEIIAIPISGVIFWYLMKNIYLWVPSLASILDYVKTPLKESNTWQIIGLTISIIIALGLYNLKKKIIIIFALIEIVGGGWTIWSTFTQSFDNSVLYALAISGGIFLIANGFENFSKYKSENDKKDKIE